MAHFAELDSNNKVLRIVVGCNQDIADNGGEQSVEAATHFESVVPFSENGVKWVQTSYNHNFRKRFANDNSYYDEARDAFIVNKADESDIFDETNLKWIPPVPFPSTTTDGNGTEMIVTFDYTNARWKATGVDDANYRWDVDTSSWITI